MAIGNYVPVVLPNVADDITDGWVSVNIWRSSSRFGIYTKLVGVGLPIPLVAGTVAYAYQDTAGSVTSWYKWSKWNGSSDSALSNPTPAAGVPPITADQLRQRVAYRLGAYLLPRRQYRMPRPSGAATATGGSASELVCEEYRSTLYPDLAFRGIVVLLTSGVIAGEEREVAELNSGGSFFFADAFTQAPPVGATFEGYFYGVTSGDLHAALDSAMLDSWQQVSIPVGGITSQTEYGLPYYLDDAAGQILGLTHRQGSTTRRRSYVGGQDYLVRLDPSGIGYSLYLPSGIGRNSVYLIDAYRNPEPIYHDTDVLFMSDRQQRLLIAKAAHKIASEFAAPTLGAVADVSRWAQVQKSIEDDLRRLGEDEQVVSAPLLQSPMVSVSRNLW
jgi:hypothetical protein